MAHAQKPDFVFRRNGRVHLNRRRRQFSRLLAAEVCASAVVVLDTPCSEVVWRVLATHSIRQFPLLFPSRASSCTITFQLGSTINTARPYSCVKMTLLGSFSFRLSVLRKFEKPVITFQFLVALSHMIRRTFWQPVFIHIWKGLMSWIASSDRGFVCTSLLSRLSSWLSVTGGNSEVATVRTSRSYRSFVWIVPRWYIFLFTVLF